MDNLQDLSTNSIKIISTNDIEINNAPLHVLGGCIIEKNAYIKKGLQINNKLKVNGELLCNSLTKLNNDIIPLKDTINIGSPTSIWYQLYTREAIINKIICNDSTFNKINYNHKIIYNSSCLDMKYYINIIFLTINNQYNIAIPNSTNNNCKKIIIYNFNKYQILLSNILSLNCYINDPFISLEIIFSSELNKWIYLSGNIDKYLTYENAIPANPEQNNNTL